MAIATINPATGETVRSFEALSDGEVDAKIALAAAAYRSYRRVPLADRAALLLRAADILEAESDAIGRLMTLEMGKLVKAGKDEALKCALGCRFYAEHGRASLPTNRSRPTRPPATFATSLSDRSSR